MIIALASLAAAVVGTDRRRHLRPPAPPSRSGSRSGRPPRATRTLHAEPDIFGSSVQRTRARRSRVASASSDDPVTSSSTVGSSSTTPDDLTGRQDADLRVAVDHRRLGEHRRVRGEHDLAPRAAPAPCASRGPPASRSHIEVPVSLRNSSAFFAARGSAVRRPDPSRCSMKSVRMTRCGCPSMCVLTTVPVTGVCR